MEQTFPTNNSERKYCVYAHCLPDGTTFYIGKGDSYRPYIFNNRSAWWKRVVAKYFPDTKTPIIKILSQHLDHQESSDIERFWIAVYGRKNYRTDGSLINICIGGEGTPGYTKSDIWKTKMSVLMKGEKNPNFGKKMTEEAKKKRAITLSKRTEPFKERVITEEGRQRLRNARLGKSPPNKGKPMSDEQKKKCSLARMGKSPANKGQKMTPERLAQHREIIRLRKLNHIPKPKPLKNPYAKCRTILWIVSPSNELHVVTQRKEFEKKTGIYATELCQILDGQRKDVRGWTLLASTSSSEYWERMLCQL